MMKQFSKVFHLRVGDSISGTGKTGSETNQAGMDHTLTMGTHYVTCPEPKLCAGQAGACYDANQIHGASAIGLQFNVSGSSLIQTTHHCH